MKKTYYHATDMKNLISVYEKGLVRGCDGIVYLTEKPEESLRFIFLRGYNNALVLEVELDEKNVVETFDHSYNFFKCRSFGSTKDIKPSQIKKYLKYDLSCFRGSNDD